MDGLAIAASLSEISPRVTHGTIRTVYQPDRARFVLHIQAGEDIRLVIDVREACVWITRRDIENPPQPSPLVMLLRKHLRGSRIQSLTQWGRDRAIALTASRHEEAGPVTYQLMAELLGPQGNLHLAQDGRVIRSLRTDSRNTPGAPYVPVPSQGKADPEAVDPRQIERWLTGQAADAALAGHVEGVGRQTAADLVGQAHGQDLALELSLGLRHLLAYASKPEGHLAEDGARATFYPLPPPARRMSSYQEALDSEPADPQGQTAPSGERIVSELSRAIRTKRRTIGKLTEWLDTASEAERLQQQANLLMTFVSQLPRGRRDATLIDPATGDTVTIPLDPSLSPMENAQSLYTRAKRIRRGHPHVTDRLTRSHRELALLEAALSEAQRGEAIDSTVLALLPSRRKASSPSAKKLPFRRFEVEGYQLWMGKSARENDALLREASPRDVWMHAKDYAGAHVVIRVHGQEKVPESVLQAAARLAAKHSKASMQRRVEVSVTQVKNVRKPKGAPAGLVNVRDADTLTVSMPEGAL